MSTKSFDEKIVSMKFDNSDFEKNVSKSRESLEKLKQDLDMTESAKNFDKITKASNNVDISAISRSLDNISSRFSAFGIAGMTVISNLTTSAMNSLVSIEKKVVGMVKTGGFNRASNIEKAKFQMEGLGIEWENINKQINYAVENTAYSLDAAALAASTLSASGVGIGNVAKELTDVGEAGEIATDYIDSMGMALRAISGVSAQASVDYTRVAEIFSTVAGNGRLMGDQLRQFSSMGLNVAADIANAIGTTEAEVREMVSKGMIDFNTFSELMFDKYAEHAVKANETITGVTANIRSAFAKIGADFFEDIIANNGPLVKMLDEFRGKINELRKAIQPFTKTITPYINEFIDKVHSMISSWDISKIKIDTEKITEKIEKLRGVSGKLHDIINKITVTLEDKISSVTEPIKETEESISAVVDSLVDYESVINEIIRGDFGDGEARFNALTEAGYDWAYVQNLVNESLGETFRYETDLVEIQEDANSIIEDSIELENTKVKVDSKMIEGLTKLSSSELKLSGYTYEQINALKLLKEEADKTGMTVSDFVDSIDKLSSRWLILDSLKNVGSAFIEVIRAIGIAWNNVFSDDEEEKQESFIEKTLNKIYDLSAAIHKSSMRFKEFADNMRNGEGPFKNIVSVLETIFSTLKATGSSLTSVINPSFSSFIEILKLFGSSFSEVFFSNINKESILEKENKIVKSLSTSLGKIGKKITDFKNKLMSGDEAAEKLKKTFEGLFATLDLIKTVISAPLKLAFDVIKEVLENLDIDVLDITSSISEAIIKVRDWIKENEIVQTAISGISSVLTIAIKWISDFINRVKSLYSEIQNNKKVQDAMNNVSNTFTNIKEKIEPVIEKLKEFFKSLKENDDISLDGIKKSLEKAFDIDTENIGTNLIQGIANGIAKSGSKVINGAIEFAKGILEAIKEVLGIHSPSTEGYDIGVNLGEGTINGIKSIMDSVIEIVKSLGNKIIETLKGLDIGNVAAVALSVGFIAAFKKLGSFTSSALKIVTDAVSPLKEAASLLKNFNTSISTFFTSLNATLDNVGKGIKFKAYTEGLKDIGIVLLMIVAAIAVLGLLSEDQVEQGLVILGGIAVIFTAMAAIIAKSSVGITPAKLKDFALILAELMAAFVLLAKVIKIIGAMEWTDLAQGIVGIGSLTIILYAIFYIMNKFPPKNIKNIGKFFAELGAAFLLLAVAIKIMGSLEPDEMAVALITITVLSLVMAGLIAVTELYTPKRMTTASDTLLKISAAFGILAIAVKVLAGIEWEGLLKASLFIGELGVLMVGLIAATRLAPKGELAKIELLLISMSSSMILLAIAVKVMGGIEWENILKGTAGCLLLTPLLAALVLITHIAPESKMIGVFLTLTGLSLALIVLAGVTALIGLIDEEQLFKGVKAMGALSSFVAVMLLAARKCSNGLKTLIGMSVAIGVMAVAMGLLSTINPEKLMPAAKALAMVMATFSLFAISTNAAQDITKQLIIMSSTIIVLSAIVAALCLVVDDTSKAVDAAIAIGILLTTMSASFMILSKANMTEMSLKKTVGAIGVMGLAIAEIAIVLGALSALDAEPSIESAIAISTLLLAMTAVYAALTALAPLGPLAASAGLSFDIVIAVIGALIVGIGVLFEQIEPLEGWLDNGIRILGKIGDGIGQFLGNVVSSFMGSITEDLPNIADDLSDFMTRLQPFLDGISKVDDATIASMKNLVGALVELGASRSVLTGDVFGGTISWEAMGEDLKQFGEAVKDFSASISGQIDAEAVNAAANAGTALAEMAEAIPKAGGIAQGFTGIGDIHKFGNDLCDFGEAIVKYSKTVTGESGDAINVEAMKNATNAGKALAELENNLPKQEGLLQKFIGEQDLGEFGGNLAKFGLALKLFSVEVSAGNGINKEAIQNAVEAATMVAKMESDEVDVSGGFKSLFSGENNIADFGERLVDFGHSLVAFSESSSQHMNFEAMGKAITSAKDIISFVKNDIPGTDFELLTTFESNLENMGSEGIDKFISAFTSSEITVKDAIATMMDWVVDKVSSYGTDFTTKGKDLINRLGTGFENAKTSLETKVKSALEIVAKNIPTSSFYDLGKRVGDSIVDGVIGENDSNYYGMIQAGVYLTEGLIKGLKNDSMLKSVYKAAYNLGVTAVEGEKDGQDSHSPSKATIQAGKWMGEGLIIGMNNMSDAVSKAGFALGTSSVNGLSGALSEMSNADLDASPTIRPVIDLSSRDINGGLNASMDMYLTKPVESLAQTIASAQKEISASNASIVNAINGLRNDINQNGLSGNMSFVQNNYSPKALSYTDIYRNTRSLFSQQKGVVYG